MKLHQYLNPLHGWNDSSAVDKVRVYTRQSFLLISVGVAVGAMLTSLQYDDYRSMAAAAVCAAATFVVVQRTPALGGESTADPRIPLTIAAVAAVVLVAGGTTSNAIWAAVLVTTAVATLIPLRWSLAAAVAAALLAAALGTPAVDTVMRRAGILNPFGSVRMRVAFRSGWRPLNNRRGVIWPAMIV